MTESWWPGQPGVVHNPRDFIPKVFVFLPTKRSAGGANLYPPGVSTNVGDIRSSLLHQDGVSCVKRSASLDHCRGVRMMLMYTRAQRYPSLCLHLAPGAHTAVFGSPKSQHNAFLKRSRRYPAILSKASHNCPFILPSTYIYNSGSKRPHVHKSGITVHRTWIHVHMHVKKEENKKKTNTRRDSHPIRADT